MNTTTDKHRFTGTVMRLLPALLALLPDITLASATAHGELPDLTASTVGYLSLALFAIAYLLVTAEEFTRLRKSKPVIIAAGLIWGLVAWSAGQTGHGQMAEQAAQQQGMMPEGEPVQ